MIDPPWPKRKGGKRAARPAQGRELDYATMPVEEIFALLDEQVFSFAAPTHNVWLWAIDQFLHQAESAMSERGYRLHARIIWDKGNGVAPAFTLRYSHEYLLWFYKPALVPVARDQRGRFTTVLKAPAREHSRKPDEAYAMVETLYPESSYMDVFSRQPRANWRQFGNQLNHFVS
ncbi:MAG TPA: MT-A70 family methyltransferase [Tepidisphaeraceae bacterium]|jgi:N6-adenosine-specific RNA methylase IME4